MDGIAKLYAAYINPFCVLWKITPVTIYCTLHENHNYMLTFF